MAKDRPVLFGRPIQVWPIYFPALVILLALLTTISQAQYIQNSTLLGSSANDYPNRMQVVNGETYILGVTNANNYPVTNGSTYSGGQDLVITKLNAAGNIVYSTYLGGSGPEFGEYLKVVNGEVYIFGSTESSNFPVTNGSTYSGTGETHLTKLNAAGNIAFSTYLGGNNTETPTGLEVVNGEIHLLFSVSSTNFPVTNGSTYAGGSSDLAYMKLSTSGNILFSTYLGGSGNDNSAPNFKVAGGKVYIIGYTDSPNFPVTNGSTYKGNIDIVYTRLSASGAIEFSSYYGSTGYDGINDFDVENGEVYLIAETYGTDFPVTNGTTLGGTQDLIYMKINSSDAVAFASYLGGSGVEVTTDLKVINGEGYFVGYTDSPNYPVTNGSVFGGITDIVYTKFAANGDIAISTYITSNRLERAYGFDVVDGEIHIVGTTESTASNYPVTNGTRPRTFADNGVYTKLNASTGQILYSTIYAGTNAVTPRSIQVENGVAYITGNAGSGYPTTDGSIAKNTNDIFFATFKLCGTFPSTPATITPASQTVCQNGFTQPLTATQIAIASSDIPTLYRNGVPEQQPLIEAFYQWQQATSPGGPWTDIAGATQKDYNPGPSLTNRYFRRISTSGPCCGNVVVNTSAVASIIVSAGAAPTLNVSDVFNTCAGSPVVIGGSPTASGGTTPYTYAWDNGAAAVANPTVNPSITTIYTLTVTDANGCRQIDQTLVNAYAAYAGADVGSCAGTPVQIGGAPIPGVPGVTYSWAPATGLSCTTCAQPFANPSSPTTYTLTLTVPITGGGTCQSTDAVVVTPVAAPLTPNFAGPDVTICIGNTATIGTPAESGFTYTWAPGNYLVTNNSAQVTFQPGSLAMPTPNPITYYVTALKNGCTFVDQMQASVIEARAGVDGCGPRNVGEPDRTPNIGETYTWTKLSGPGNFVGPTNLPQVPVTASVGGATTYRLTVSYNGTTCTDDVVVPDCGCVVDIKVQAPFACPSFGLNGGNVKLIATAADIYSTDPNVFTYTWSPAAGLSSSTGREVTLTDNVQRTYTVTMSSPFDPSFACTRTITVNNPAWSLPVFTVQDVSTCPAVPVQIGAPPVAGYAYEWVGSVLSSTAVSNPTATVTNTTLFSVKVTDIGSGCITRDTVQVSLATAAADAGLNQSVCPSGIVTLGTPAQPNTTYSWSPAGSNWQNGTNQNSAQPQALVAVTTVFSVTATNAQSGCTSVDQVTVTAGSAIPSFTLPDRTYCPGSGPVSLGGTAPTGTGYTYSWAPAALVTNATTNATSTLTPPPSIPTTFTLTVRNTAGCVQVATQTITPTNTAPNPGSNQVMCLGNSVSLGSASNPTGGGITYSWTPATGLSSATSPNPTFTPTAAGVFSFTLTKTEGACSSPATVTVTVNSFTLAAIPSVAVCQGACTTIGTTPITNVQYSWSPTTGLSNPNSATTIACVNTSTTYTLTAINLSGCVATRQVLVGVNNSPAPSINIPSVTACLGSPSATFNPVVSPSGSYNYVWSPNNGTLNTIYASNPTVNLTSVGTKFYSLTVTNTATGCSSSQLAQLDVEICCVKPDAGQDISICPPATTAQLNPGTSGGTWTAQAGNPAAATVSASGAVSGMTANGIYRFIYSVSTNGTTCTDTVAVSRLQPLSMVVTPGVCLSATNQYSISGTISLTNVTAGTLTITDGAQSTTLAVSNGSSSVPFSFTGLTSGSGSHTVTASLSSCGSTSATYTAPASCTGNVAITVTPGVCVPATNQYSISGTLSFTNSTAGTAIITDGVNSTTVAVSAGATSIPYSLTGLSSGTGSHTVTVSYAGKTASATYTAPASCLVGVTISVTPGACVPATNQYSISGTLSLTNAVAGTAIITDGVNSTTVTISAGATSVPYSLMGLNSGTGLHTVTVSYANQTASATYTAPASCSVGVAISVTPGACVPATNQYAISGTVSLTNAVAGTATITDGATSTTVAVSAGATSVPYSLTGLTSGTGSHTVTVSYASQTASTTYTAPASCSVGVALSVTPGVCVPATNQYAVSGTLSLTNAVAGTATITDGTSTTTVSVSAGQTSVPYSLSGLSSGTGSHTLTVSYASQTASVTYSAPASCTLGVALVITPGVCQSATNSYTLTGTLSLTNASAGTATFTDGATSTTVAVAAGQTSVSFSLTGLSSGTGSHTLVASFNGNTQSQTYTAPASCTVAIAITATPGACVPATNQYSISGTLSLTNAIAGTATITDGATSTTVTVSAGATSVPYSLTGFTSGTGSHTVTVSYASQTASATYTAPASCSVGVAISVTPGACVPATNQYSISGTVSLTNAVAGTATITDGTATTTVSVSAGDTSVPYILMGLNSGTGSHTVTVSYAGQTASTTYTAPASCTLGVALVITPGLCQSATNSYTLTGTLSLTNAQPGNATFTDGTTTQTVAVTAGQTSVSFSLTGLSSGTGSHTLVASFNGNTQSQTYTAPASCSVGVALSVTPGVCVPATNQYSISGTLSLTNAIAGTATITDGATSTTVAVSAGATSAPYSLTGLSSGTGSHTVTVAYASQTASITYTAPASCTVGIAITATPGACVPATNQYSISGTLSLTNAIAGTATITDGATSTTVAVSAGATSVPYSLTGFTSGTGSHTVTVSYASQTASATYSAPASCSVGVAISVTPGACVPATNQYAVSGTLSLTNAVAGTATITDGTSTTTVSVSAGQTSVPYTLAGLNSGTGSHTLTVSYASQTASVTYTAPASCTLGVALVITPGVCQSATNSYTLTGTLSLTNAQPGNATFTDGTTTQTVAVTAGQTSVSFSLTGLSSGTGSHTLVASFNGNTQSQTYTAPASCSVGVALSVTPGACVPATNQYSISGTLSLTNAIAGTATITDGATSTTVAVSAGATSAPYSLTGLSSGTGSHTVTVAYASQTASITYTAPASCTVGIAITATPGACVPATNQYSISGTLSLTNAIAGTATITDGATSTTVAVSAGATSVPYSLTGFTSGTGSHTVTVSYASQTASITYAAPASCSVGVALSVTPGACVPATNQYAVSGTLSLTNAVAGTATITDGTSTTTVSVSAGQTSVPYTLAGLNSGTGSHTLTVSYASQTASVTYTAPTSCTLGVALVITPGVCQSATNSYTLTGTLSLTNASAGTATFTDGATSTTVAVAAGQTSVSFSLTGLSSGTGSHTLVASFNGNTQSQTYTAPASCSVGVALSVTPGACVPATNQYSISGTLSLTNAIAGTATITDGATSTTVAVSAGATSAPYSLTGLSSGTGSHTVTVAYASQTASITYTAPASCTVGIAITATPGACVPATNQYSISGTLSLTNAIVGTATISDGATSTTVTVSAGATSVPYSLTGFTSGTGSHTVTVSYASQTASVTYTAPASCSVGVAISVTPGVCVPATNQYAVSGTLSLTNAVAGTATITDGTSTTTVSVSAGQTSVPYTLAGLNSGTGSHTLTVSYASQTASATYTAPVSCTVVPPCLLEVVVTPGLCQSATNQYTVTGSVSATNASGSQLVTITDGLTSTTVTLTGNGPASFTLTGLASDGLLHTVTVSAASCGIASTTYTAPASCTVDVAISVTPGVCQSATNQYTITGTLSLTNAPAGTATITDGAVSTTVVVSAGATSVPYSLTGLTSGTESHTVTVNFAGKTATVTYTAPVSCEGCPPAKCVPIVIRRTR